MCLAKPRLGLLLVLPPRHPRTEAGLSVLVINLRDVHRNVDQRTRCGAGQSRSDLLEQRDQKQVGPEIAQSIIPAATIFRQAGREVAERRRASLDDFSHAQKIRLVRG
jgi:hypothetical protein